MGANPTGADAQLENPVVPERRAVPLVPNVPDELVFCPLTKFSTPGEVVALIPTIPKTLVPVVCLRRLMPGEVVDVPVFVLPAVTLLVISRQTVLLLPVEPESTRMPARAALVVFGAARVLFLIAVLRVQVETPRASA